MVDNGVRMSLLHPSDAVCRWCVGSNGDDATSVEFGTASNMTFGGIVGASDEEEEEDEDVSICSVNGDAYAVRFSSSALSMCIVVAVLVVVAVDTDEEDADAMTDGSSLCRG